MSAVINGAPWTATCIVASAIGVVSLSGNDGTQQVALALTPAGLGTYTMTPLDPTQPPPDDLKSANAGVTLLPTSTASRTASMGTPNSSGTLTVTALSAAGVAGSFSFTAVATPKTPATGVKVVSGSFNVSF
jgi:hypothetical protein